MYFQESLYGDTNETPYLMANTYLLPYEKVLEDGLNNSYSIVLSFVL